MRCRRFGRADDQVHEYLRTVTAHYGGLDEKGRQPVGSSRSSQGDFDFPPACQPLARGFERVYQLQMNCPHVLISLDRVNQ
jgi:hypothetical protein